MIVVVWQHRGALTKAVEKCLPYPPLFKPKSPWMAAAFAVPEAVEYLRKKGAHVILFVNVLGSGQLLEPKELMAEYTSAMLWQELRRSLERVKEKDVLVINVITTKNKIYDFSSRNALVMAGEKAGQLAADQLVERFGF